MLVELREGNGRDQAVSFFGTSFWWVSYLSILFNMRGRFYGTGVMRFFGFGT